MRNLQVYIRDGQLLPISQYDAEQLEDAKPGQAYNLKPTGSRSNPHHNLYWSALRNVCKATGKWPTEKHLHEELKFACGYYKLKYEYYNNKCVTDCWFCLSISASFSS